MTKPSRLDLTANQAAVLRFIADHERRWDSAVSTSTLTNYAIGRWDFDARSAVRALERKRFVEGNYSGTFNAIYWRTTEAGRQLVED